MPEKKFSPTNAVLSLRCLAEHHALEAGGVALLGGDLEVAVDDTATKLALDGKRKMANLRDSEKNTGTRAESTEEVASDRESANASTTEGGSRGNNTLQLLVHGLFTVTGHDETLLLELLGNIPGRRARNFNPGLGENGASDEHVGDVDDSVDLHAKLSKLFRSIYFSDTYRVKKGLGKVQRRGHVVGNARGGVELSRTLTRLPDSEETDEEVIAEAGVEHLRDEEDVGAQGGLEHDRL